MLFKKKEVPTFDTYEQCQNYLANNINRRAKCYGPNGIVYRLSRAQRVVPLKGRIIIGLIAIVVSSLVMIYLNRTLDNGSNNLWFFFGWMLAVELSWMWTGRWPFERD